MYPTFLYHHTAPKGKIFTDEDEFRNAIEGGWVEAPWLVVEPVSEEMTDGDKPHRDTTRKRRTTPVKRRRTSRNAK